MVEVDALFDEACSLHRRGLLKECTEKCLAVLNVRPHHCDACHLLGIIAAQSGASFHQAIAINPNYAEAYSNRGIALREMGQLDAAVASCDQAIRLNGDFAEAHFNRGVALKALGQLTAAVASYESAIAIKSEYADAHYNRANALKELKRLEAAPSPSDFSNRYRESTEFDSFRFKRVKAFRS